MADSTHPPVVLILAGSDPSGGAGICADIQAVSALGAHPAPVITTLTVQDTRDAYAVEALAPDFVIAQARAVLEDLPVRAVKLGLLGTAAIGRAVAELLAGLRGVPVVIDPVLAAAGGAALAEDALGAVYRERLLPHASLLTPNALELERLAPDAVGHDARVAGLLALGVAAVLVKGGDEPTPEVTDVLHRDGRAPRSWCWPRRTGSFHGSGCTLASAIAARLAHGDELEVAVDLAERFTQRALARSWRLGRGQRIPARRPCAARAIRACAVCMR